MKKITIITGRDFSGDGEQLTEQFVENRTKQARERLVDAFGGFTETHTIGGWRNPISGKLVQERGIKWEILAEDDDDLQFKARFLAAYVRSSFRQFSVVLEINDTNAQFVEE